MIDIILGSLLLLVGGSLLWMERSRIFRSSPAEADVTVIGGGPEPGYFWKLARPAGLTPDRAWPFFVGSKLVLSLALPAVAAEVLGFGVVGFLIAGVAGFFVPDLVLAYVRRQRQANIRRALSFFLDLIVSLLQAGLTLEEAFKRAAREGLSRDHPLAEEANLVAQELDLGRDRTAGFQALAERTGVRELRGLANALALGLGSGASVETTLRAQAELARAKRREEGLRRLQVASAEVLVPLLLCGFPVFIVMVFFPLAILLLRNLELIGGAVR